MNGIRDHKGFIIASIMLATIMQALDTTIANVALPHMQGNLNATQDQIAWVLTSYIVAAAIATPLSGYLATRLGRKNLLLASIIGFTLTSALCGMALSLSQIVAFRLLQGVFGAGLIPLSQAVLLDTFPKEKHGQAMAIWGVGVMLGPILGPTLGGYLTEYYNWRWIFYINVPIGILTMVGVMASMPPTPPDKSRPFDFFGFGLLAISIGALQLFLDRGQSEDWFSSPEIIAEATISALCFYMFIVHMFTARHPFLEIGLFKDRNYVTSLVFMFLMGVLILAVMALLPTFLQHLMGYPILTTGLVLAPRGIGTMVAMMLVGRLIGKIDTRLLIFFGLSLTALSLWHMSQFNLNVSQSAISWTGVMQGFGMGFVFIPLSTIAYATLEPQYRNEATALFSLVRNIGSSIGVSVVIALLVRNTQLNHAELGAHLNIFNPGLDKVHAMAAQAGFREKFGGAAATMLNGEVTRQAAAISYLNDFKLIMYITLVTIPLLAFMKVPRRPKAGAPAAAME
ncbi:MAG: DHA2 family efflux MFS transporter permease subunit [Chloroflexi bacterium]|nr:DHA2 family efflux MFS transporter permease subunit [Chloroflexota bacterium]